jgi:hypothetical protein
MYRLEMSITWGGTYAMLVVRLCFVSFFSRAYLLYMPTDVLHPQ